MQRISAEKATERGFLDAYQVASILDNYEPRLKFMAKQHIQRYAYARRFVVGKKVLDVACGTGYGCPLLLKHGAESYTGIDLDPEAISLAMSRYLKYHRAKFIQADAQEDDILENESYDVIVSFETIEHIKQYDKFLKKLYASLKPGGDLLISSPNRRISNPTGSLQSKPNWDHHEQEWTLREFKHLLKRHGFSIREVRGQVFYAQRYRKIPGIFKYLRLLSARPVKMFPLKYIAEPNYFVIRATK